MLSRRRNRRGLLGACVLGTTSYLLVLCALSFRELSPPKQQSASKQEPQQLLQQQLLHVCVATDEPEPYGLIALANSTIRHASATSREALRFHVIVPPATRKRLRLVLEALFPSASFRLYTLEIGGVRAKIVRHLRRHEREAVLVSPYRYAHAYLPSLMPSHVRRVLWLHTDVLVLADVGDILDTPLQGAPAAAVEDCRRPSLIQRINASHPLVGGVLPPGACGFDPGVLVIDIAQWALLDMSARVEYWQALNLRAEPLFAHDDAHAALLLALLPVYARLPPVWAIGELSERRVAQSAEEEHGRFLLRSMRTPHSASAAATAAAGKRLVVLGVDDDGESSGHRNSSSSRETGGVVAARAIHFNGPWKPWLRNARLAGVLCVPAVANDAVGVAAGAVLPCADLWAGYARHAVLTLDWHAQTMAEARHAASVAAAAAVVAVHDEIDTIGVGTPPLEADATVAAADAVHVTVVYGDNAPPYGLAALINSTVEHASVTTRAKLRFHVVTRPEMRSALSHKLQAVFDNLGISLSVVAPSAERLAKLTARLESLGLSADAFGMAPLWLSHTLPGVPRTLLLSADALVLVDVAELHAVALGTKVCAVIEDCSVLFENVYNYHHPLFATKHARSSCSFDSGTMVVDLRAWRMEDVPARIIELMGTQRRTEGLYALPDGAAGLTAPMMLALDKRALKLPSWWLARGLAREAFAYDELRFWQRLYGQDGVSIPFQLQPFRAVHVVRSPARDAANALIVRFSGGPYLPWLRSCSPSVAAHAPRCGRGTAECFRLWRPYLSRALIPLLRDDGAGADAEEDGPVPRLECVDTGSGSLSSRSLDRGLVSEHARGALSGRSHGGQQQQQQAAAEKGQTIEPDTQ